MDILTKEEIELVARERTYQGIAGGKVSPACAEYQYQNFLNSLYRKNGGDAKLVRAWQLFDELDSCHQFSLWLEWLESQPEEGEEKECLKDCQANKEIMEFLQRFYFKMKNYKTE